MLENIKFEKFTDGTDLAYVKVRHIEQDSQGFIWFATDKGLVKYDGLSFKIIDLYREIENVPVENNLMSMCLNKSGNFVICTGTGTLLEFNKERELSKIIEVPFHNLLKGNDTLHIIEDDYDNLWIGTDGHGLFKFNKTNGEYCQFEKDLSNPGSSTNCNTITQFYCDNKINKLYIGTMSGGLNIFNYESKCFSYIKLDSTDPKLQRHTIISFIYRDTRDNLWVGTPARVSLISNEDKRIGKFNFDHEPNDHMERNYVTCMCEDDQGLLWIGTMEGLICFDFENKSYDRFNLTENNKIGKFNGKVERLFKDSSNVIWIGTKSDGIGRFDRNQKKFHKLENEIEYEGKITNDTYTIFKDSNEETWVGTLGDGIYKYRNDPNNKLELIKFKELEFTSVTGFTRDVINNLWVGCNKFGLVYIDTVYGKVNLIDPKILLGNLESPYVYTFCQCADKLNPNHLWLSIVLKRLVILDTEKIELIKNKTISDKFDDIPVSCLFFDTENELWIGTYGFGIYKYSITEDIITQYYFESDIGTAAIPHITVITEDTFNNIWIGTLIDGLYKCEKQMNEFKKINTSCKEIAGLIFDENNYLWISSENKMLKLNTQNYEAIIFNDINEFNLSSFFKSSDGTFYFGGKEGITYFKPDEITTSHFIPNIVITDFQIFYDSVKPSPENPFLKKSISYAKEIMLTHKESVITFEFAALIFNNPKRNQYAYKMEGFDDDWVYCGTRRTATYTNLDPGEYTFRVKGSNNDGLWNEEGTSIKIIISPPWYKTVLFKGLVGLSVIGSIGSFYRKRIQKLNKEKSQHEEFTKKLIESQENERKRVAAELHDSLGQDLLIIKNKALVSIKKNEPEKLLEQMNEISELTSATLNDVREISYNLRPYELDRLGLTKTIESMIERANNSTSINFVSNIDNIDKVFIPEVEINIYRIIQESLNNVIKHSDAKEVIVSVLKKEKEIVLNISDDGKGFDIKKYKMNSNRKGFGLKGIEERVRLLKGELTIDSGAGKGTELWIKILLIADDK